MEEGIDPLRLLFLTSKPVRLANCVKLNWVSVPLMFALKSFTSETMPVLSQATEVQMQRLLMFSMDQELRDGGEKSKLFFH